MIGLFTDETNRQTATTIRSKRTQRATVQSGGLLASLTTTTTTTTTTQQQNKNNSIHGDMSQQDSLSELFNTMSTTKPKEPPVKQQQQQQLEQQPLHSPTMTTTTTTTRQRPSDTLASCFRRLSIQQQQESFTQLGLADLFAEESESEMHGCRTKKSVQTTSNNASSSSLQQGLSTFLNTTTIEQQSKKISAKQKSKNNNSSVGTECVLTHGLMDFVTATSQSMDEDSHGVPTDNYNDNNDHDETHDGTLQQSNKLHDGPLSYETSQDCAIEMLQAVHQENDTKSNLASNPLSSERIEASQGQESQKRRNPARDATPDHCHHRLSGRDATPSIPKHVFLDGESSDHVTPLKESSRPSFNRRQVLDPTIAACTPPPLAHPASKRRDQKPTPVRAEADDLTTFMSSNSVSVHDGSNDVTLARAPQQTSIPQRKRIIVLPSLRPGQISNISSVHALKRHEQTKSLITTQIDNISNKNTTVKPQPPGTVAGVALNAGEQPPGRHVDDSFLLKAGVSDVSSSVGHFDHDKKRFHDNGKISDVEEQPMHTAQDSTASPFRITRKFLGPTLHATNLNTSQFEDADDDAIVEVDFPSNPLTIQCRPVDEKDATKASVPPHVYSFTDVVTNNGVDANRNLARPSDALTRNSDQSTSSIRRLPAVRVLGQSVATSGIAPTLRISPDQSFPVHHDDSFSVDIAIYDDASKSLHIDPPEEIHTRSLQSISSLRHDSSAMGETSGWFDVEHSGSSGGSRALTDWRGLDTIAQRPDCSDVTRRNMETSRGWHDVEENTRLESGKKKNEVDNAETNEDTVMSVESTTWTNVRQGIQKGEEEEDENKGATNSSRTTSISDTQASDASSRRTRRDRAKPVRFGQYATEQEIERKLNKKKSKSTTGVSSSSQNAPPDKSRITKKTVSLSTKDGKYRLRSRTKTRTPAESESKKANSENDSDSFDASWVHKKWPDESSRQRDDPEQHGEMVDSVRLNDKIPDRDSKKSTDYTSDTPKQFCWTDDELDALKQAHCSVPATRGSFWAEVAAQVSGRSEQECRTKWFDIFKTPIVKKAPPKIRPENVTRSSDDFFDATPFRHEAMPQIGSSLRNLDLGSAIKVDSDEICGNMVARLQLNSDDDNEAETHEGGNLFVPKPSKSHVQHLRREMGKAVAAKKKKAKRNRNKIPPTTNIPRMPRFFSSNEDSDIKARVDEDGVVELELPETAGEDDFWDSIYEYDD